MIVGTSARTSPWGYRNTMKSVIVNLARRRSGAATRMVASGNPTTAPAKRASVAGMPPE